MIQRNNNTLNGTKSELFENGKNDFGSNLFLTILMVLGIIVGVILILFLLRKWFQGGQYRKKNRIDGKIVIVTGCNTGIGKQTALELAKRGAKVYMACRDSKKCEEARLEIVSKSNNPNVFNRQLDLSSLESVKAFVEKFNDEEPRLDILINNAGIMGSPKILTKDGFESQIGVNHMGHFALTNLLLDKLRSSAPSRIVVVSSMAYLVGRIYKDDFNSEKSYNRMTRYGQSKLANILFTRHLAKKLKGTCVTVNSLHPGVVNTELPRYVRPKFGMFLFKPIISFVFKSPKSGAQTSIKCAIDPDLDNVSGEFFMDCIKVPLLPYAKNDETAEWLWNISEEWTGIKFKTEN